MPKLTITFRNVRICFLREVMNEQRKWAYNTVACAFLAITQ